MTYTLKEAAEWARHGAPRPVFSGRHEVAPSQNPKFFQPHFFAFVHAKRLVIPKHSSSLFGLFPTLADDLRPLTAAPSARVELPAPTTFTLSPPPPSRSPNMAVTKRANAGKPVQHATTETKSGQVVHEFPVPSYTIKESVWPSAGSS